MSYRDARPATFPGGGWYAPSVTASPQTTLTHVRELSDEERAELEDRERRRAALGGFGFARALEP
jgi:hypothetical protein